MSDMVSHGYRVVGCAPDIDATTQHALKGIGVEPISIPLRRTKTGFVSDIILFITLIRLFRKFRPEYVLTYTMKPIVLGNIAASLSRVPHITSIVAGLGSMFSLQLSKSMLFKIIKIFYRIGLSRCSLVVFQNPNDLETLQEHRIYNADKLNIVVGGSGIDLNEFPVTSLPEKPVFLLAARLIEEKGIKIYRNAAKQLRQKYPYARFFLAGWFDKDSPSAIKKSAVDGWIAEGSIEYKGHTTDMPKLFSECSTFVLPSYYREGVPRTSLEALSSGRAVVTTDSPGCRESVLHKVNGFLVPPKEVDALVVALEKLIEDHDLRTRMGKESRRLAERKFDVRKVNKEIIDAMFQINPKV